MKKILTVLYLTCFICFRSIGQIILVSTATELQNALNSAVAGHTIQLSNGNYLKSGGFVVNSGVHGTASQPITVKGSEKAVLSSGSLNNGYGLSLKGNNYWVLDGFSVHNAAKGVVLDNSCHNVIQNVRVLLTGEEGIHLRSYSSYNAIQNCFVDSTGNVEAGFGEGIYIGSANSNWITYTNGNPDTCNYNTVQGNSFGDHVGSENIDIKEGTTGGTIVHNTFNGNGLNGVNSGDSWIDVKGNGYLVACNTGSNTHSNAYQTDGFQTHIAFSGWGDYNTFSNNALAVSSTGYGINIQSTGSNGTATHNVVCSNNTVSTGTLGISNMAVVSCFGGCNTVTSIEMIETEMAIASISPNPFQDRLEIQIDHLNTQYMTVQLINLHGQVLVEGTGTISFALNTTEILKGTYLLRMYHAQRGLMERKVLKF